MCVHLIRVGFRKVSYLYGEKLYCLLVFFKLVIST